MCEKNVMLAIPLGLVFEYDVPAVNLALGLRERLMD